MDKHEVIKTYHKFFDKETSKGSYVSNSENLKELVLSTIKKHYHRGITSHEIRDHLRVDGFAVDQARVASAVWSLLDKGKLKLTDSGLELV